MVIGTEIKKKSHEEYCSELMKDFSTRTEKNNSYCCNIATASENCFTVLTSRQFCYLSRSKAEKYKKEIVEIIEKNILESVPIKIFLDIGGGYHAMVSEEKNLGLSNNIGIGELLLLRQIKLFNDKITDIYSKGVNFSLVVDNFCAEAINGITESYTAEYIKSLRSMIVSIGMEKIADVVAESEIYKKEELLERLNKMKKKQIKKITEKEMENIERFTGKKCCQLEATEKIALYSAVISCSEELLSGLYSKGIHLTQRHTEKNLCFRAFPGSDVRIQAGIVSLLDNGKEYKPILLTTKNHQDYSIRINKNTGSLPKEIKEIIVVENR